MSAGGPANQPKVEIYDTTLRDGSQQVGLDLTVADKLRVAAALDALGVDVVEGGWPGSNPKDAEFFARVGELDLKNAQLAAFGATRLPRRGVDDDANLAALLAAQTPIVTLVGKAWTLHVDEALRTTREENLAMVADSVAYMAAAGRRVVFDAEHFFDGYRADRGYALAVLDAAIEAGADTLALCDTNGGTLPDDAARVVAEVAASAGASCRIGVHFHNDSACAVANSVVAVSGGALHVQGAANGYGERCGNADLFAIIAGLELKRGHELLPPGRLAELASTARTIAEFANLPFGLAPALRRLVGVRDQGGPARLGDRPAAGRVRARRSRRGRQPAAGPGQRAGRAQQRAGQGGRARPGPVARAGHRGAGPGQGGRAPRVRVRGRRRLVRAAGAQDRRGAARVVHPGQLPGDDRALRGRGPQRGDRAAAARRRAGGRGRRGRRPGARAGPGAAPRR